MADNVDTQDFTTAVAAKMRASDDGTAKAAVIVSEMGAPTATFTRPADVIAYAANDAVNNSTSAPVVMTFTSMARGTGMGGMIVGAKLIVSTKNAIAAEYHLLLFDTTVTMNNDNAALDISDANSLTYVGHLMFSPANMTDTVSNRMYLAGNLPVAYRCAATGLYGVLTTRTAFTPGNADVFKIVLDVFKET